LNLIYFNLFYRFLSFSGLKQGENYTYSCTNDNNAYNIVYPKFKDQKVTKIITVGDWSNTPEGVTTLNYLTNNIKNFDLFLFLGDLAYNLAKDQDASGPPDGINGNKFLKQIYKVTSQIPFMMTMGNHDVKPDLSDVENRFFMPNHDSTKNQYYSFGVNNIHFINLNSAILDSPNPNPFTSNYIKKLQDWLNNDLKRVASGVWKIVFLHRTIYCSNDDPHCLSEAVKMRKYFEEILNHEKVDLVISGHLHVYERGFPTGIDAKVDLASLSSDKNTYTNPIYPTYVVCGAAGQSEGLKKTPYDLSAYTKIAIGNHPGVCQLEIKGNNLTLNYVNTATGSIEDTFSIIKSNRKRLKLNKIKKN